MDFPQSLESFDFVSGLEEFKQTLTLLIKNPRGAFMQDYSLGSLVDVHTTDAIALVEGLRATAEQISGVRVDDCSYDESKDIYNLSVVYKDQFLNFKFNPNINE